MGWQQMLIGAVVGQVTEYLRERRKEVASRPVGEGEPGEALEATVENERAVGGRLNPLNAAEDMLKRVVDHAQFRTDQSVARAAEEVARTAQQNWPEMVKEMESAGERISERTAERVSVLLAENVKTFDAVLSRHRVEAQKQVATLLIYALAGVALVGAALILLAWMLR